MISSAAFVLADESAVRWTSVEMLGWLNDAQREIAIAQPEASAVIANITLVAGTKQTLPAGAIALARVIRNMGSGGATPGVIPRMVMQSLMDTHRPSWHSDTATLSVVNWMKSSLTPRIWYCYPPMSGATQVEAEYSVIPTPIAATASVISLDDFYANPMVDYVLYRAFSKDVEIPGLQAKADRHRAAFERTLGLTAAGEKAAA